MPDERLVAEAPCRPVDVVGNEDAGAGRGESQDRDRDRCQAGGYQSGTGRMLQRVDGFRQGLDGRCVRQPVWIAIAETALHRLHVGKKHRGGANQRRVDETVVVVRMAPGMGQDGIRAVLRVFWLVVAVILFRHLSISCCCSPLAA